MYDFTVAIPVYNGAEYISDALRSLEAQSINGLHILISDNASSDNTVELIKNWKSRHQIELIERTETLPHLAHFNFLLSHVKAPKYMLLCHDDYLASPQALEKASRALDEHPQASAVYCDLAYVSAAKQHLYDQRFKRTRLFMADDAGRLSLLLARNMFGIPLAIRSSSAKGLGYKLELPYSADLELSWRLSQGGLCVHINEPLICNRYRSDNLTWNLVGTASAEMIKIHEAFFGMPQFSVRLRIYFASWAASVLKRAFKVFARVRVQFG